MRFARLLLSAFLCLLTVPAAGDDLYGPVLGWIADVPWGALRPIRGIPGAASIGDPVTLGGDISRIAVAPRRSRAYLVTGAGTREVALAPDGALDQTDPGLPAAFHPSQVTFSPTGAVAAFYDPSANELWLTHPDAGRLDLSQLPGAIALLAVSDRADRPLAGTLRDDPHTVFVLDAQGGYRRIPGFTEVTDLTFVGASAALAVADAGARRVLLLDGSDDFAAPDAALELPGAPDAPFHVASSADGALLAVLVAGGNQKRARARTPAAAGRRPMQSPNPVLGLLRLAGRRWNPVDCVCSPVGLFPVNGNAVFRLTDRIDEPLWILDGDSPAARAVFIPAVPK